MSADKVSERKYTDSIQEDEIIFKPKLENYPWLNVLVKQKMDMPISGVVGYFRMQEKRRHSCQYPSNCCWGRNGAVG